MSTVEITCFSYTHYTVSTVCGHVITKDIVFLNKFLRVLCVCVHAKKASGGGVGVRTLLYMVLLGAPTPAGLVFWD